jgi:hypothetical protein
MWRDAAISEAAVAANWYVAVVRPNFVSSSVAVCANCGTAIFIFMPRSDVKTAPPSLKLRRVKRDFCGMLQFSRKSIVVSH